MAEFRYFSGMRVHVCLVLSRADREQNWSRAFWFPRCNTEADEYLFPFLHGVVLSSAFLNIKKKQPFLSTELSNCEEAPLPKAVRGNNYREKVLLTLHN